MKLSKKDLQKIIKILKQHEVKSAGLFGSYARGEATKKSDIDFLIEFNNKNTKSLLDIVALKLDLEDNLKKKCDIVTKRGLHFRIRPYVKKDLIKLYD
ncbi:MAG: hypothetical protein AUJ23_01065 [Candidatus Magasanikbacteria bacterium CG1_02_32_51]|uniref:Polymerase nucleotidyl transferase domain-containing protein n=1 Tax=Candidatus Magasanikbacteria bacterium CG1_02_32_51 TaxID=1805238 RepID=A0A1J4UCD5_9BACT|nr:MAG: hypothetical protein AUJ23_01065 [Candidatus Magasanikbacteria bacterium CG1_02_32_51]